MAVLSTEAFVLRSYKLAENDKIVVLFTRASGKIRLVAKGARKTRNRFGASLEVFAHVRAMFRPQENRELLILERAELLYSPFEKQTKLRTNFYLFYFAELISEFCPDHERMPTVFRLLCNIEQSVQQGQNLDYLARYVELQLLRVQGILSSVVSCSGCRRHFLSLNDRRFIGSGGEILCKTCRSADSVFLSSKVVSSIDHFEKGSSGWADSLEGKTLQELASLNHLLITRFLGKELQSHQFRKKFL